MASSAGSLVLYHHPLTRAATVIWMLEEVGVPYRLEHVDLQAGAHRAPDLLALNPMGKLPILVDDGAVITESAAIGLYLADRYALGRLAPLPEEPARGPYLRWSLFAPSVIEPGCYAAGAKWDFRPGQAGWGRFEDMLEAIERAIGEGPWLLGERFTMADVIFGGTLRFMLMFGMVEPRPSFVAYRDRLEERPASRAAADKNAAIRAELGLET